MSAKSKAIKSGTKSRFSFNINKDIILLKSCLQHNPWQLGSDQWKAICDELKSIGWKITTRTIKFHVDLLLQQYKKQSLITKTGTEEEVTERGELLNDIEAVIQQSEIPINRELGADDDIDVLVGNNSEAGYVGENEMNEDQEIEDKATEKKIADKERDEILLASTSEFAPGPISSRIKRSKLTPEDELIKRKQEHDIEMDRRRADIEEKKMERELELESQRIDLEKAKLDLELKKEGRLAEESKRRDEIFASQLQLQNNLCTFIQTQAKK